MKPNLLSSPPSTHAQKSRIDWIDIAKGIAILCTIIGHTVPFGSKPRDIIFAFHMPIFFLLAGYTFKAAKVSEFSKKTYQDFKRLILPCCITDFLLILWRVLLLHGSLKSEFINTLKQFLWGNGNDFTEFGINFYGVGVLWFLIALFWSRQVYRIILHYLPSDYRVMFLLFGAYISMLIGQKARLPQGLDLIMVILFFMECGYQYHKNAERILPYELITGLIAFFLWTYLSWDKEIYIELATRQYPGRMLCIIIALSGCFSVILLSKSLESLKLIASPLKWLGTHSLQLLCIHHFDWNITWTWESHNPYIASIKRIIVDLLILFVIEIILHLYKTAKSHFQKNFSKV